MLALVCRRRNTKPAPATSLRQPHARIVRPRHALIQTNLCHSRQTVPEDIPDAVAAARAEYALDAKHQLQPFIALTVLGVNRANAGDKPPSPQHADPARRPAPNAPPIFQQPRLFARRRHIRSLEIDHKQHRRRFDNTVQRGTARASIARRFNSPSPDVGDNTPLGHHAASTRVCAPPDNLLVRAASIAAFAADTAGFMVFMAKAPPR